MDNPFANKVFADQNGVTFPLLSDGSASVIIELTEQFGATHEDGIGYMYGSEHTNKPAHPIVTKILKGEESRQRLIPRGNKQPESFWLPKELR